MALTPFQREVLKLLALNRSPNSVFAGGTVANREGARISDDFDIEHHAAEAVLQSFHADAASLRAAGYRVTETPASRPRNSFVEVVAEKDGQSVLQGHRLNAISLVFGRPQSPAPASAGSGFRSALCFSGQSS